MKLAAEISSKTAELRFDKLSNQLVKSAKHIYSEKATYHELTEGMRAWVLKKSDIKKKFHLTRSFFTHLNKGEHMLLSEFVRFTNWIFTHYPSEEVRLEALLEVCTVLFCHTKEKRRLRLASILPSSQPDLRGHDREGSEEASREGVKNPRLEEGPGRDWKKMISFF